MRVSNLGVKKFRKMLRKGVPEGFQVFQVVVREVPDDREKSKKLEQDSRVAELL